MSEDGNGTGRNYLRSDLRTGKPAWMDWITVVGLFVLGAFSILLLDAPLPGVLALLAGLGFGTLVAVAEAGLLTAGDSETSGT